jgi:outer membrane protein assembly factor BamD (BamD/ComL family)
MPYIPLLLLAAVVFLLAYACSAIARLKDSSNRLEEVCKALERIGDRLEELCRSTRLSEKAKAIAFRDAERNSLQEAVLQKLNQGNYEAAYELIDEIGRRPEYQDLAEELRCQADRHRQAVREQKIEPIIAQIERLLDEGQWSKASVQIEGLIKAYPDSEKARSMRQRFHLKREERKKALLSAWDEAVKRQDTDRSLEILKELDRFLTPNEALALQEAARDVFRTKLHNLGVKFSLAVSDRNWAEALAVGQQIITEFPNSRMAEEIRGKLDILKQNVQLIS